MMKEYEHPTRFRLIASLTYDVLAIISIWLLATALFIGFVPEHSLEGYAIPFWLYIFALTYFIYMTSWTKKGQSLGQLSWHLKVCQQDGSLLTISLARKRFFLSVFSTILLGVGTWWILIDPKRLTLYDRMLSTRIIKVP